MIPASFDYVRPGSLDEAIRILNEREGEAKLLAGGYSLIPLLKLRLGQPGILVDLQAVGGLDGIIQTDDDLRIGAKATHRQIHENDIVANTYPFIADVAGGIGDPQVRNWGTIGGSIAHADPASDWPAALLAANATIIARGKDGERAIKARDFFVDTFTTAVEPTEVLTEVRIPRRTKGVGGGYSKLERRVGDFATVGVAVVVSLDGEGRFTGAGIGVTGVSPNPFAATNAEPLVAGVPPHEELYRAVGDAAAAQSEPAADVRGPVEYKRAMVAEMTVRSFRIAVERARAFA
ncbi:MAG TPA: xanthine dehydrogenase family protein subunit M [Candidatus Limnocylindrales bacterium]|nr:xanthine dehydrogenase family protein subunit M [Candidatus Limnocylindrales bacterium]